MKKQFLAENDSLDFSEGSQSDQDTRQFFELQHINLAGKLPEANPIAKKYFQDKDPLKIVFLQGFQEQPEFISGSASKHPEQLSLQKKLKKQPNMVYYGYNKTFSKIFSEDYPLVYQKLVQQEEGHGNFNIFKCDLSRIFVQNISYDDAKRPRATAQQQPVQQPLAGTSPLLALPPRTHPLLLPALVRGA